MRMRPKRRKGTESVVILGVSFLITITSAGFWGTSFDVMMNADIARQLCFRMMGVEVEGVVRDGNARLCGPL